MTLAQAIGLALLAASLILAPIVGRRLHNEAACPVCQGESVAYQNQRRASRRRHPSNR